MKRTVCLAIVVTIALTGIGPDTVAAADKLKLLIVDGQNNHDWKTTTPILQSFLEKTNRFTVNVATSPPKKSQASQWDAFRPRFADYDVVLSNYNGQLWPKPVRRNLSAFVSSGGALVVVHAANNAFPEWKEWNEMIGLGWRGADYGARITVTANGKIVRSEKSIGPGAGHGSQHPFSIVVRDRRHPVMKGMPAEWMHFKDELYHGQRGPAQNMNLLATAFSSPAKGGTDAHEPMVWWIPFGKGRVFTTVMGHAAYSMKCVGFQTVVARGAEWAASGKVTLPIPKNFPTAEKTSVARADDHRRDDVRFSVSMQVDLGEDIGQNFGTLFEATDASGRVVAGAGFLGSCNTEARSNRRKLNFYVKDLNSKKANSTFTLERLPRVNDDAGVYLHEFGNRVFAHSRGGGQDGEMHVWDNALGGWKLDKSTPPLSVHLGQGTLVVTRTRISYDDRPVLELAPDEGQISANYYSNGFLVIRRQNSQSSPPENEMIAFRWKPSDKSPVELSQGTTLPLRTPREFVYACGQLGKFILAATNTGGLYSFDGDRWKVWLEPDLNVSFQIYAMMNFEDRLLMGQYPTGNLFEFDGSGLQLLKNWPPVMKGVRNSAREAQTLTIYGGDMYAGVWPWGEVWKYDRNQSNWSFVGRMFTHPQPTTETTHPYEIQTKELGSVLNRWGQRVTSMIPHGDSMFISTSAKSSRPYEPKFTFLNSQTSQDYGAVYRYRQPGHLSVQTVWKNGPTRFEFRLSNDRMTILQDGRELGSAHLDAKQAATLAAANVSWGQGVYGDFRGTIKQKAVMGLSR